MGIPKFFRWLTRRYPMILQAVNQLEDVPPIDNLYLDLNGIVHQAIHGNDPKRHERISKLDDLEELWASIMRSIDELVHVTKPKKVLFLAVDGVAPRAKMNQQRARRFKSAKEREMLTNQLRAQGKNVPEMFDTNAISPGTEFMVNLCNQLHFFLKYKLNTDPLYQGLKECIISDGHVPGEGEHKMLDYIRKARTKAEYDPNTRHCFYGADADLIMLSLLTHEPHFTIIREEHVVKKQLNGGVQRVELSVTNRFQLIHISLLREYFQLEYKELVGKLRMKWDIERIIDDFVFFCFFIGNDFLPNISALDIGEGSLDRLIDFYKLTLPTMDDYITHQGVINWERAQKLMWILAEHEDEVFKERLDSSHNRSTVRTVSVTQDMIPLADDSHARDSIQTFNLFKDKIHQKKVQKVARLKAKGDSKKFKKFLIAKMFKEDAEHKVKIPKDAKAHLMAKFQKLYAESHKDQEESKSGKIYEMVQAIEEECFSDLQPEDIPDDCVSDLGENIGDNQTLEETAGKVQHDSITSAAAEMSKHAEESNELFMKEFIKLYAQNTNAAKALYYLQKVHFDINTPEGQDSRRKMMKKYLEGIQWVLYYYYRGALHWRWYYPYHYAPLIGDFGINLVKDFLAGVPKISNFEIDYNCPEETEPYTPFQQLLSIMPIRSFKLLPPCYRQIATNELKEFFPDDFPVDLNGKTLAWEAIVLIPFVDQALFLEMETKMFASGHALAQKDIDRNKWNFIYYNYTYCPSEQSHPLPSTLTSMKPLPYDHTKFQIIEEYKDVGEGSFAPQVLPGCVLPCPGYPSFKQLNVIDISYETIVFSKVQFKKVLVKIPQCIEETQPEKLEEYLQKLTKQHNKAIYIDFPYQREAWPMYFEDMFSVYTLYGDGNKFTIQQNQQTRTSNEWEGLIKRVRYKLTEKGIDCPPETTNVLVTCSRVQHVKFSSEFDNYYFSKLYDEKVELVPLSLIVRRRDPKHYLNVDSRCVSLESDLQAGQLAVFLKNNLFGIMGKLEAVNARNQLVKILIDKQAEEAKVHNPFMGEHHIRALQASKSSDVENAKAYFGENNVDQMLNFLNGTTARVTSSFMLTYKDPKTKEQQMVDIGLNLKSWTKQMHVAGYVRFSQSGDNVAVNQFDGYQHNQFARGSKHIRAHWEYSIATVDTIKQYIEKFPEVFKLIGRNLKKDRGIPKLKDLYGDDQQAVDKLKQILMWIDSLPISHLPFVEMGFDALTPDMIKSLNEHRETIQNEFQSCNLVQKTTEWAKTSQVFVEKFPFWTSPFPPAEIDNFLVGDRIMNINSTQRHYIPFGLRGTIVGKTQKQVIVCFDQQFLHGSDINGHCEMYRGALMDPNNILNLTRKFRKHLKEQNTELVQKFTEVHPSDQQPNLTHAVSHEEEQHAHQHPQVHQQVQQQAHQQVHHQEPKHEKKEEKAHKQHKPNVQKQASTGYAQKTFYQAKSYQPMKHVEHAKQSEPMYRPRQPLEGHTEEAKIQVALDAKHTQDQAQPVQSSIFEDPAIAAVQNSENQNLEGLPKLSFAPIKEALKTSPEFQQLMQEMNQPQSVEDMMTVLQSLMGTNQDASSTSQAMMNPLSKPFVPTNPETQSKETEPK